MAGGKCEYGEYNDGGFRHSVKFFHNLPPVFGLQHTLEEVLYDYTTDGGG